ncbi:MAG: DUF1501 domain-containing protein, partial [Planctomycetales bacterium]|nr:DUF1501 domain-containing protein [Planctomycetales bacterium]
MNQTTRRQFLTTSSASFGAVAMASLFGHPTAAASQLSDSAALDHTHHAPRAKRVIFCYMSGGVSHVDSFDPKPALEQWHGKPMPVAVARTQFNNNGNVMASPFRFQSYGESGIPVSDIFREIG